MKTSKIILIVILSFIGLVVLDFGGEYYGLIKLGFFGPKRENVKRTIFENTQSYVEGKRQDALKYRLEYLKEKDPVAKEAIRMTIVQSFANFDESKLEPELASFIHDMKYKN
jgi:hypothetical protein